VQRSKGFLIEGVNIHQQITTTKGAAYAKLHQIKDGMMGAGLSVNGLAPQGWQNILYSIGESS
jgi:hypothetical protein